ADLAIGDDFIGWLKPAFLHKLLQFFGRLESLRRRVESVLPIQGNRTRDVTSILDAAKVLAINFRLRPSVDNLDAGLINRRDHVLAGGDPTPQRNSLEVAILERGRFGSC